VQEAAMNGEQTFLSIRIRHIDPEYAPPSVLCSAVKIHCAVIRPGRPTGILDNHSSVRAILCFENMKVQIQPFNLSFPTASFVRSHGNPFTCIPNICQIKKTAYSYKGCDVREDNINEV